MKTALSEVSERPPDPIGPMSPVNSSSSGSGSDSESDTDSSSEDSDTGNLPAPASVPARPASPPEPAPTSPKHEEEPKPPPRWNLGSYLDQDGAKTSPAPNLTLPKSADSRKKATEESDCSDSTKELDIVVLEALAKPDPMLSSLSDSENSSSELVNKRTKRFSVHNSSDSDSEIKSDRTKKKGPMNRASPRKKSLSSHSEDESSDVEVSRKKDDKASNRKKPGRPKKVKSGSENEVPTKRRGRPPTKTSGSENDSKVRKRGRPLKSKVPSPSSSEDEDNVEKHIPPRLLKRDSSLSDESPVRSHSTNLESKTTPKKPIKHPKSVTPRSEDDRKKSVGRPKKHLQSDDDEWGKQNIKKKQKLKERSSDTSTTREKDSPKKDQKRKGKNNLNIKSVANLDTTTDSESDQDIPSTFQTKPLARVPPNPRRQKSRRSSSSGSEKSRMKSSDSERSSISRPAIKPESPVKVEAENKPVQDKKKNDTLRKLFTPKRDSEGGKGGGKGGAKGGKGGKGKGGVIIVEGDYERHSSSVEDEVLPTAPITYNPLLSPIPNNPGQDLEKSSTSRLNFQELDQHEQVKIMCKIDLSRLSFIPTKRRSEEMRSRSELSDTRQKEFSRKEEPKEESDRTEEKKSKWDNLKKDDFVKHKIKGHKRKRHASGGSVSSVPGSTTHRRKEHRSKDSHKSKRRKAEAEVQSAAVKSEDPAPTNHERDPPKVKVEPEATQSEGVERRTYYSYFEKVDDDRSDDEGRLVILFIFCYIFMACI